MKLEQGEQQHGKDLHAAMLGQRGGQKRMAGLNSQERRALAKYTAHARWHPLEAKEQRERAQEIVYLVKEALKKGK